MNYTLNQLRIYNKVVELESITKASEELHLTQPAVSIQIRNFQDQFDIPLFEQIGRRIYITNFGKEIAESSKSILGEVEKMESRKMAYLGHLTGKLNIAVVSTGKYVMPYFLSDFMKDKPGVQLEMDVTNKKQVVQSLAENSCDFALVSVLPENLKVEYEGLMDNKLYLVGSKSMNHEKIKKPKDLLNVPLIFREEGSATRKAMEDYLKSNDLSIQKSMSLTSNEAVKQAVLSGLGYSIMPLIGIRTEIRTGGLEIIPMKKLPVITRWNLVWLKGKSFSPVASAFIDHIRENKESIIARNFNLPDSASGK